MYIQPFHIYSTQKRACNAHFRSNLRQVAAIESRASTHAQSDDKNILKKRGGIKKKMSIRVREKREREKREREKEY